ncbi:penicillin-binding transpeptidase domain-containing protein [Paenibacillus arenosi]|uniref:PASTA domain-containing protein n=1 Tax=Paenibacillus arenosi TaxID=2774142 RepID=A0ABR9AVC6_9BACL|nr:penicillin-binding transpeptidase domain-containing protein [Paenibacillus arenosi]MBD8497831.1 PASTA domain-containing protein [Paenibacillus arenosi]
MLHNKRIRIRSLVLGGFFILCVTVILIRLFWIQVVNFEFYEQHNNKTWAYEVKMPAHRGDIVDRNGKVLAASAPSYHVVLHPEMVRDNKREADVARELSRLLGTTESKVMELVNKKKTQVELHPQGRHLPYDRLEEFNQTFGQSRIQGQDIVFYEYGVRLQRDTKRYYPYNETAAHILGYIDREGKPIMGIEAELNHALSGKDGSIKGQRDLKGYPLPQSKPQVMQPKDGQQVQLTLDVDIQKILEDSMQDMMRQWNPKFAVGYVMDPKTMEILAMASAPTFNPNSYSKSDPIRDMKNNALYSRFEPGSTFKLVTLAAAVEEKKFNAEDKFLSGKIIVGGEPLHDVKRGGWGTIDYLTGVKKSSNVGFVKMGQAIGEDVFMSYADAFGMNGNTGVELGDVAGFVRYNRPVEFATTTYGQGGVVINGLQMTSAYAAVANGGEWMTPQLVKSDIPPSDSNEHKDERRRVISVASAKQVSEILEEVVLDGTGQTAQIPGIRVAGKTGTAQRAKSGGGYSKTTWLVSFAGYAPVEDPKYVIGIVVDDPQLGGDYTLASQVAMPVFKSTMERSLRLSGVVPSTEEKAKAAARYQRKMPDVTNKPVGDAVKAIQAEGMNIRRFGQGGEVLKQYPSAQTALSKGSTVYILTDKPENIPTPVFDGLSLRDVLAISSFLGIKVRVEGEGYVTEQTQISSEGEPTEVMLKLASRTVATQPPDSG